MIDLQQFVLEQIKYNPKYEEKIRAKGGVYTEDTIILSASMLGSPAHQNYLRIKHKVEDRNIFSDASLGTVVHKGLEEIVSARLDVEVEKGMIKQIAEDAYITGTADVIYEKDGHVHIHDYKTTKKYAVKQIQEKGVLHHYSSQMAMLKLLAADYYSVKEENIHTYIELIVKDADKMKQEPVWITYEMPTMTTEETYQAASSRINTIRNALQGNKKTPECEDLWPRRTKTGVVRMRCEHYCDAAEVCEYRNSNPTTEMAAQLNW